MGKGRDIGRDGGPGRGREVTGYEGRTGEEKKISGK
jgi:hypothetical protein